MTKLHEEFEKYRNLRFKKALWEHIVNEVGRFMNKGNLDTEEGVVPPGVIEEVVTYIEDKIVSPLTEELDQIGQKEVADGEGTEGKDAKAKGVRGKKKAKGKRGGGKAAAGKAGKAKGKPARAANSTRPGKRTIRIGAARPANDVGDDPQPEGAGS